MLSKKDFIKIAGILRDCPNELDIREAFTEQEIKHFKIYQEHLIALFCEWLIEDNKDFNKERFIKAVYKE